MDSKGCRKHPCTHLHITRLRFTSRSELANDLMLVVLLRNKRVQSFPIMKQEAHLFCVTCHFAWQTSSVSSVALHSQHIHYSRVLAYVFAFTTYTLQSCAGLVMSNLQ